MESSTRHQGCASHCILPCLTHPCLFYRSWEQLEQIPAVLEKSKLHVHLPCTSFVWITRHCLKIVIFISAPQDEDREAWLMCWTLFWLLWRSFIKEEVFAVLSESGQTGFMLTPRKVAHLDPPTENILSLALNFGICIVPEECQCLGTLFNAVKSLMLKQIIWLVGNLHWKIN